MPSQALECEYNPVYDSHRFPPPGTAASFASERALVERCLTPRRSAPLPRPTLFLIGDSHAGSLNAGISLAVRGRYQVRWISLWGFGVLPQLAVLRDGRYLTANLSPGGVRQMLTSYRQIVDVLSAQMRRGDVLAIMQSQEKWLSGPAAPWTFEGREWRDLSPLQLLERDLIPLAGERHVALLVFGDFPQRDSSLRDVTSIENSRTAVEGVLRRHSNVVNAHFVPLKQLLCDAGEGGTCLNTVPGTDLNAYHDNFHLNTGGSIYLWPHLCDAMESIGLM